MSFFMSMTYFLNAYCNDNIHSQTNLLLLGSLCHCSDLVSDLFKLTCSFGTKPYIITYICDWILENHPYGRIVDSEKNVF